ncbi:MAG: thioredoxin family protein [Planctomycetales bacterium]|nr:thioredoxin family protein [Planctomycetales bacterium]
MNTMHRTCWLLAAALLAPAAAAGQEVKWLRSAEQAAAVAAQTGKPILVYVRSASCHYCDLMQTNVWQDPTAAEVIMRDFVPLKLTREENAEAVKVLQIKGFPSTIIFSADRRYVDRLDGYLEPGRFLAAVQKMRVASSAPSAGEARR